MNMIVTNVDQGSVILNGAIHKDELLTFAGAGTVLEGTILARNEGTLKLVPYVKGGTAAVNGTPGPVLTYDVTAAGAGDENIRAMVSGEVRKERLIIDADGDDTNIDNIVIDGLRDLGIVATNVTELAELDNQ